MSRTLTDHDSIRRWADEHGARPACVMGTGDGSDVGMIRLDFEGYSGEDSLQQIGWDDWFRKFDESQLALIVDDRGTAPNFNKLVRRDDEDGAGGRNANPTGRSRRQSAAPTGQEEETEEEDDVEDEDELEEQGELDDDDDEFDEDEDSEEEDEDADDKDGVDKDVNRGSR
jgi:hypothetical protein